MSLREGLARENGHDQLVAEIPDWVVAALDHVTPEKRVGAFAAAEAFARHEWRAQSSLGQAWTISICCTPRRSCG